jgi:pimeloyl-ACP methyl ester carboxylesterase
MRKIKIVLIVLAGVALLFALGPKVRFSTPKLLDTDIEIGIQDLEKYIDDRENIISDLKPDNQARIVWADSTLKHQTEYSLVYLHGFSSSQEEGDPVHIDFAKRYNMNLYLSRLEDHGRRDSNSFEQLTTENLVQSAEDALDIGKILGKKVIVMSCSTGSTLAIILASAGENIHSMIMYSPNIDIYDSKSELLLYPWGKQLSDLVMGGSYNKIKYDSLAQKYWNSIYHTNGLFVIKNLINDYMTQKQFKKINIPLFLGYYYKDDNNQDKVVSVKRMLDFYNQVSTREPQKKKVAFAKAGSHVVCSYIMSKDIKGVESETFRWAEEVLGLVPVK